MGAAPFDSCEYAVRFRPIQIVFFFGGGGGGGGGLSALGRFNLWGYACMLIFITRGRGGGHP